MIVARQGSLLARLTGNERVFTILAVSPTLLAQSITQSLPISRRSSHLKRYLSGVTCHIYLVIFRIALSKIMVAINQNILEKPKESKILISEPSPVKVIKQNATKVNI